MKFSKKQMAFFALVPVLIVSNIVFAVLYMTRSASITGGVASVGSIELYEVDGTEFTSFDFPLFDPFVTQQEGHVFFLNNTGNIPVYVNWNISDSSIDWETTSGGTFYHHIGETGSAKYSIALDDGADWWHPNDGATPESLYLTVGEGLELVLFLQHYIGGGSAPETFTVELTFYAEDA